MNPLNNILLFGCGLVQIPQAICVEFCSVAQYSLLFFTASEIRIQQYDPPVPVHS